MTLLTISVRIAYLPNRTTLPHDASARDGWMSWTAAARSPSGCTRPPATTTPPGERPQVAGQGHQQNFCHLLSRARWAIARAAGDDHMPRPDRAPDATV